MLGTVGRIMARARQPRQPDGREQSEPDNEGDRDMAVDEDLTGVTLRSGPLRARVTDNSARHCAPDDGIHRGYNGLASLIHEGQRRNVFAPVGFNYECSSTSPEYGAQKDAWDAPRVAPMTLGQPDEHTARLTQTAVDCAGLNAEIVFRLSDTHVDQSITLWPDRDVESSSTFWASYMNMVQNTSLFVHGALEGEGEKRWLEMTSAGHSGGAKDVFFRSVGPAGKDWHEFLTDNPVRRQAIFQTPETVAATEAAGFRAGRLASFDRFMFGFVDDYVLLWIFREPEGGRVHTWISASGGGSRPPPGLGFRPDHRPARRRTEDHLQCSPCLQALGRHRRRP